MKKDAIDKLFNNLQGSFDLEEPTMGHQDRFLEKLNAQNNKTIVHAPAKKWWLQPLSIAASIVLLISVGLGAYFNQPTEEIVSETTEVEQTQFYFASVIEQQLEAIQAEATPETKILVDNAMVAMKKLEEDYAALEAELQNNGDAEQILNAMITNFQTRINLLQDVLENIKQVKQLKNRTDEITTT